MTKLNPIKCAQYARRNTIDELECLIFDLQRDLNRLVKAQAEDGTDALTIPNKNTGFYLSQHAPRYEQVIRAGAKMEEWAKISQWEGE